MNPVQIIPVEGLPDVTSEHDLPGLIVACLEAKGHGVQEGDVLVVTSKVVSKNEGRAIRKDTVKPSRRARALSALSLRDPVTCELVLQESVEIVTVVRSKENIDHLIRILPESVRAREAEVRALFDKEPMMILARMPNGSVLTDAGIDTSNVKGTEHSLLGPKDPDASCKRIRDAIKAATGKTIAVICSDTDIRPGRLGTEDQALGSWGIESLGNGIGKPDMFQKPKVGGVDAIVDILAAAGSLLMGQTDAAVPAAVIRGLPFEAREGGIRPLTVHPNLLAAHILESLWFKGKLWVRELLTR